MTDLLDDAAYHPTEDPCPAWCACDATAAGNHLHRSADVVVSGQREPLVGRLIGVGADVRVEINERAATLEESRTFVDAVRRLLDDATLAEPGLGFVATLAARARMGVAEMAMAAGLESSWVRAQQAGGQVLTLHEYDQLALAVARVAASRPSGLAFGGDQN